MDTLEDMENLNKPTPSNTTESVLQNLQTKISLGPDGFTAELY